MAEKTIPASATTGVKPFMIGGRMVRERERVMGMTDVERAWRAQYIKDQILGPSEPRYVPEYWAQRFNPIRKFYKYPLDRLGEALVPMVGKPKAEFIRFMAGKFGLLIGFVYAARYYMLYNSNDWTRRSGWSVTKSKKAVFPGDPGFPKSSDKTRPQDFCDKGFSKSPI